MGARVDDAVHVDVQVVKLQKARPHREQMRLQDTARPPTHITRKQGDDGQHQVDKGPAAPAAAGVSYLTNGCEGAGSTRNTNLGCCAQTTSSASLGQ